MNGGRGEGDGSSALAFYHEAAARGDAHSQAQLGKMYLQGVGVVRDFKMALAWFLKSAEQGNGEAQAYLGHMVEKGLGVEADIQQAVEWYEKSAAQGSALGRIRLGDLHLRGMGVDGSIRKALACYLQAAEQDRDAESAGLAYLRLGAMYCQGRGVEKDLRKGFELYQKAAKLGNREAQINVGTMYRDGMGVERNHKKAAEWFQRSSGRSKVPADRAMGDLYRDGLVVERNVAEAIRWYKKAAESGDNYAKSELVKLEQEEASREKFESELIRAGRGDAMAMAEVAAMFLQGAGVKRSEEQAREWYKKALAAGNTSVRGALQQLQRSASTRGQAGGGGPVPVRQPEGAAQPVDEKKPAPASAPAAARTVIGKRKTEPPRTGENAGMPAKEKPRERKRSQTTPPPAAPSTQGMGSRVLRYLVAAAGVCALALAVVFIGFGKRSAPAASDVAPALEKIVVPPRSAFLSFPSQLPEPPPDAPGRIVAVLPARQTSAPPPAPAAAPPPAPVRVEPEAPRLRSEYRTLDEEQVAAMLAARRLFDAKRSPEGDFPHRYEAVQAAGLRLVVDRATRLVWTRQQGSIRMNLGKTRQWIESLNRVAYGGIRSWRLPTVEEAASLLARSSGGGHLDAVFGGAVEAVWTGDSLGESESWSVDFAAGTVRAAKKKSRLMALMVSSDAEALAAAAAAAEAKAEL